MSDAISEFATEYTVCALPREHCEHQTFAIKVAWRGSIFPDRMDHCWAVCRHGRCINGKGEWDYEPQPSSRTDAWIKAHRFTMEMALRLAREAAPLVNVNGYTPTVVARLNS